MIIQAMDLKVGDVIASGTGTATVEAVKDFGGFKEVTFAANRTMRYIDDVVVYSVEMNPFLKLDGTD